MIAALSKVAIIERERVEMEGGFVNAFFSKIAGRGRRVHCEGGENIKVSAGRIRCLPVRGGDSSKRPAGKAEGRLRRLAWPLLEGASVKRRGFLSTFVHDVAGASRGTEVTRWNA
jgi:hypothetical protein